MRRIVMLTLTSALMLAVAQPAFALVAAPQPIPQRIATAHSVVVGKVVRFEEKNVTAETYPGNKNKGEYQVAVVKIKDAILGLKGLTQVRVGVIVPKAPRPGPGIGGPIRPTLPRRPGGVQLQVGQEYMLLLHPHHKESFYLSSGYGDVIQLSKNTQAAKQVKEAKETAKLLNEPMKHLKSTSKKERFDTAAALVFRYRQPRIYGRRAEKPISAAESELILKAIADADWPAQPQRFGIVTPLTVFQSLGINQKDGFERPRDYRQYPAAAQAWLKKNMKTYRIKKVVEATK